MALLHICFSISVLLFFVFIKCSSKNNCFVTTFVIASFIIIISLLKISENLLWIMCNRMVNWNISHDIDGRYIMRHVINSKLSVKSLQVFKSVEAVLLECEKWDWCNFKGYYFSIFCGLTSWNEAHFSQDVWMTLVHSYLRCRKNLLLKIK